MAKHRLQATRYTRPSRRRAGLLAALLAVVALLLSGCGQKAREPYRDAPVDKHVSNKAIVVEMPDGFSNMATVCGPGGMRYTVAYHGDSPYGALAVVLDASCPK